jgi:hypothetical protein
MPERTRTLGQVIGVKKTHQQRDNTVGSELKRKLAAGNLTTGLNRAFAADSAEAATKQKNANEYKAVGLRVEDALAEAAKASVEALDVIATQDATNTRAKADVVIGDEVLLKDVPISHLLFLEHYFGDWKGFLSVLPTLDPVINWTYDEGQRLWKSDTDKTRAYSKEPRPILLHPGTDKHPPQTQLIQDDVYIGEWERTLLSGAITEARKKQLLEKIGILLAAFKDAVAVANHTQATEVREGKRLLDFLLKEDA